MWLDTYEAHVEGGGDGAADPVFTSDVLKQGYPYLAIVKGTYGIWGSWAWPAERACGVREPWPVFPSRNTANGKVGNDSYGRLRMVVIALHIDGGAGVEPGS